MRKHLLLLRHGKSDWDAEFPDDHERPLAKRGRKAARVMGKLLARAEQVPDRVYTSTARRARDTVELAAQAGEWDCEVVADRALYEAEPEGLLEKIRATPDSVKTLLLAGHEPTWSELIAVLTGGGRVRFPTAALARIDFVVTSWEDVRPGEGELVWLLQPKFFSQGGFDEVL